MQVLYLCLYLIYKKTSMDLNKKHLLYLIVAEFNLQMQQNSD